MVSPRGLEWIRAHALHHEGLALHTRGGAVRKADPVGATPPWRRCVPALRPLFFLLCPTQYPAPGISTDMCAHAKRLLFPYRTCSPVSQQTVAGAPAVAGPSPVMRRRSFPNSRAPCANPEPACRPVAGRQLPAPPVQHANGYTALPVRSQHALGAARQHQLRPTAHDIDSGHVAAASAPTRCNPVPKL